MAKDKDLSLTSFDYTVPNVEVYLDTVHTDNGEAKYILKAGKQKKSGRKLFFTNEERSFHFISGSQDDVLQRLISIQSAEDIAKFIKEFGYLHDLNNLFLETIDIKEFLNFCERFRIIYNLHSALNSLRPDIELILECVLRLVFCEDGTKIIKGSNPEPIHDAKYYLTGTINNDAEMRWRIIESSYTNAPEETTTTPEPASSSPALNELPSDFTEKPDDNIVFSTDKIIALAEYISEAKDRFINLTALNDALAESHMIFDPPSYADQIEIGIINSINADLQTRQLLYLFYVLTHGIDIKRSHIKYKQIESINFYQGVIYGFDNAKLSLDGLTDVREFSKKIIESAHFVLSEEVQPIISRVRMRYNPSKARLNLEVPDLITGIYLSFMIPKKTSSRVATCPAPGCNKTFIKKRSNQIYCCPRCRNRKSQQTHRQRQSKSKD